MDNAANKNLIDLISRELQVKRTQIEIIRGLKSKTKTIRIYFNSENSQIEFQKLIKKFSMETT